MRNIVLLGMNHETASVELRECMAFTPQETADALEALKGHRDLEELVLFSTCNRVELLMVVTDAEQAMEAAKAYLSETKRQPVASFEKTLYVHRGEEAVRHVFRVASSLDSMMVGEPQILGQIKAAYTAATGKRTSGVVLNRLLHRAFFVAKKVRNETGIGDHAVSISYAAIELGRKIFGSLEGKKVLLVGAGEMAELAVEHLIRHRAGTVAVVNRTFERGVELADRFKGRALRFEEIGTCLREVDIVISSTGAPGQVITYDQVKGKMKGRRNRPLFFIDIAVPRDVDPRINRISNCYVYDIDDLNGVIEENRDDRLREALKGERIVDEAVIQFRRWHKNLDAVPTIVALRQKLETIAEALQRMKEAMVKKILHDPALFLKGKGCHGDRSVHIDAARKIFGLDRR
jgi:glutamyl-tRNA reductase